MARAGLSETAGDTLAGAVTAAERMNPALGAQVLEAARQAFTTGLNLAAAVSAVMLAGLAALAILLLRHVPPIGAGEEERERERSGEAALADAGREHRRSARIRAPRAGRSRPPSAR